MNWKVVAGRVAWDAVNQGRRDRLPPAEILERVDAAYPFGARDHWPYRVWLRVRAEIVTALGLDVQPTTPRDPGPLFGERP